MADEPKSKLWIFLNSNFGLFMMSSIFLSFITWSYTQWTDSIEQKKVLSEKLTKLETEISYRVQVMQSYFGSECSDYRNLSSKTFKDIDEIYVAAPSYQAIFPENAGKDLHILIWELSAVQQGNAKHQFISCFDSLLQFNAYLNRLQNQVDAQGLFYGENVDYEKEVETLKAKFASALAQIQGVEPFVEGRPFDRSKAHQESNDGTTEQSGELAGEHEEERVKSTRPTALQYSVQELLNAADDNIPISEHDIDKPFLLPVEDAFSITGRGTVATGRIHRGKIHVGDEVELVGLGAQRKTVVTSIEMFRKLSDEGKAGDHVGLLLRGISKQDIKRGMVLAMPGSISPHTHFDAEVYVLAKDEGGRQTPFFNGYRPQFYFRTTEVSGSIQLADGVEMVMPGDHITMRVELTSEIAMEEGLPFAVREGGRTIGAGIVTSIIGKD